MNGNRHSVLSILGGAAVMAAVLVGCGGGGGGSSTPGVVPTQVAAPLFTRNPGYITESISLEMTCATVGASIHYTVDGSVPSETSTTYSAPVSIDTTTTVQARAYRTGMTPSPITYGTFTVTSAFAVASVAGAKGSAPGAFQNPFGLTEDGTYLYVADTMNNRIQKVVKSTLLTDSTWGVAGAAPGEFRKPFAIARNPLNSFLYVADTQNNRIQILDDSGVLQGIAAGAASSFGTTGPAMGEFNTPGALACDAAGNVYVADSGNHRIQKFDASGVALATFGSFGVQSGQFYNPYGVAVTPDGSAIYVADTFNNRIQKLNASGAVVASWGIFGAGDGQFNRPFGLALDAAGNVFVADSNNNRVQKFDASGVFMTQFGFGGTGNGDFYFVTGLVVDAAGDVFVADNLGCRIERFSPLP